MLTKTKAIVLHKINYSESSMVVHAYSREYGKVGFLIKGAKRKRSIIKTAFFEPLSHIEVVGKFKDLDKLVIPREVKLNSPFISMRHDIIKQSIALFISEVLHKCIRHPYPDTVMYDYIERGIQYLEQTSQSVSNFHIVFLLELTKYFGFYPKKSEGEYFDIREGCFTNYIPERNLYLQGKDKAVFFAVLGTEFDKSHKISLTSIERKRILSSVLSYLNAHIDGMGEIKSHLIFETVFD